MGQKSSRESASLSSTGESSPKRKQAAVTHLKQSTRSKQSRNKQLRKKMISSGATVIAAPSPPITGHQSVLPVYGQDAGSSTPSSVARIPDREELDQMFGRSEYFRRDHFSCYESLVLHPLFSWNALSMLFSMSLTCLSYV